MLSKFAKVFVALLLEAANEFILELHSHIKDGDEVQR